MPAGLGSSHTINSGLVRASRAVTAVKLCGCRLPGSTARPSVGPGVVRAGANRASPRRTGEIEEGFNPWQILRVSRGTTFQGLMKAKEMAKENAEGNEAQLQEIERAFRFFVDASQQRLEEQVRGAPDSPDVAFQYANFLQTVGENASAQDWYLRALELDPKHIDSMNQLAMLKAAEGDLDAADDLYGRAEEVAPDDVDILFNHASVKLAKRDIEATRELVDRIVVLNPELQDHPLVRELHSSDS